MHAGACKFIALLFALFIADFVCAQSSDYYLSGSKFSDKINNNVNTTFSSPADIITDYTNGLMYVADKFHNRIVYCYLNSTDSCREYTITWNTLDGSCSAFSCITTGAICCSYPAYLKDPTGVAVDTLGNMWIADRINNRVVYCSGLLGGNCHLFTKRVMLTGSPTGAPAGSPTSAPTAFSNPYSIVLGTTSSNAAILYVTDLYNNRIVACQGLTNLQTEGYTGCTVYAQYYTHNSVSTTFNEVRGLALDGNYVYVCDSKNKRIVVCLGISLTATSCQTYASGYNSGSAFGLPYGTARSLGYLYFADWTNNTVGYCVGDTTGTCYTYTDTAASIAFARPSGIGVTPVTFEIYISDATNNRIVYISAFTPGPSYSPTVTPTTMAPSTTAPTVEPTIVPTVVPTIAPTYVPTVEPTIAPTTAPTLVSAPTVEPTIVPTISPSLTPTYKPSIFIAAVSHNDDDDAALIGGIIGGIIALFLLCSLIFWCIYLCRKGKKEKDFRTFELAPQDCAMSTEVTEEVTEQSIALEVPLATAETVVPSDNAVNIPVFVLPIPPPKELTAKEKIFVCDEP